MPSSHFVNAFRDSLKLRTPKSEDPPGLIQSAGVVLLAAVLLAWTMAAPPEAGHWLALGLFGALLACFRLGARGAVAMPLGIVLHVALAQSGWLTAHRPLDGAALWLLAASAALLLCLHKSAQRSLQSHLRAVESDDENRGHLLDALLASNQDCLALVDTRGEVRAINRSGLELLAAESEAGITGSPWLHWWPLDERERAAAQLDTALGGEVVHFQADCPNRAGVPCSWDIQLLPVFGMAGQVSCALSLWRDTTPQANATREERRIRDAYAALLGRIDDAFIALDNGWRVVFANPEAKASLRCEEEMVGQVFWKSFPELLGSEFHRHCIESFESGEGRRFEHFMTRHQTWLSVAVYPSEDGIALLIRDVTEQVRSEVLAERHRAKLAMIQDISGFGDWEYDIGSGTMELGRSAARLIDANPDEARTEGQRLLFAAIDPTDRAALLDHLLGRISHRQPIDTRFPIVVDGRRRVLRMRGDFVVDEAGQRRHLVGTLHDITESTQHLDAASRDSEFAYAVINALPHHLCVLDRDCRIVATNRAWDEFAIGHGADAARTGVGANYREVCEGLDDPNVRRLLDALDDILAGRRQRFQQRYLLDQDPDSGEERWFDVSITALRLDEPMLVICHENVSAQQALVRRLADSESRFRELTECIPDAVFLLHPDASEFVYAGPGFARLPGRLGSEPAHSLARIAECLDEESREHLLDLISSSGWYESSGEMTLSLPAEGEAAAVEFRWVPVHNAQGRVERVVGMLGDATERVRHAERLRRLAFEDRLTRLPNRTALLDALAETASAGDGEVDLLFINLDDFRRVNESIGHPAADALLQQVAARLLTATPHGSFVARLDGDEFAVLARADSQAPASALPQGLLDCLRAPFESAGEELFLSACIGSARFPGDGESTTALMRRADAALNVAKQRGRGIHVAFAGSKDSDDGETLRLRADLRRAQERGEFSVVYQSKHASGDRRLLGFEALLRWRRGSHMVSPAVFIPLLEESGEIVEVGAFVLHEACRQLAAWHRAGFDGLAMAVNVSPQQMRDARIISEVSDALVTYGLDGAALELEITESAFLRDPMLAERFVAQLRALGVRLALDDFGTGFSSLSHLRRFAPDVLKIDKSFIDDVGHDEAGERVVQGIIQLARSLGIETVAEGVELDGQAQRLRDMGCDLLQGYLLGRPSAADDLQSIIEAGTTPRRMAGNP